MLAKRSFFLSSRWGLASALAILLFAVSSPASLTAQPIEMVTIPVSLLEQIEAEIANIEKQSQIIANINASLTSENSSLSTQNLSLKQELLGSENYSRKLEIQVNAWRTTAIISTAILVASIALNFVQGAHP